MSKIDRFIEALTKDLDLSRVSFMGIDFATALAMLRSVVSEQQLEQMIDSAVKTWGTLD